MQIELITQDAQDRELSRRVRAAVADRFFPALQNLQIEVRHAVATLRGRVPTSYERRLARYRARGVPGILGVVDAVEVESPSTHCDCERLRVAAAAGLQLALVLVTLVSGS